MQFAVAVQCSAVAVQCSAVRWCGNAEAHTEPHTSPSHTLPDYHTNQDPPNRQSRRVISQLSRGPTNNHLFFCALFLHSSSSSSSTQLLKEAPFTLSSSSFSSREATATRFWAPPGETSASCLLVSSWLLALARAPKLKPEDNRPPLQAVPVSSCRWASH